MMAEAVIPSDIELKIIEWQDFTEVCEIDPNAHLITDEMLREKVKEWISWDKNSVSLKEIISLSKCGDFDSLSQLMNKRISFGTAGLRSKMGPGFAQINDLTIIQTTQGIAKYLLKAFPDNPSYVIPNLSESARYPHKRKLYLDPPPPCRVGGVVVGFDGRHNSRAWAWMTSSILMQKGIPVYLFSVHNATPLVPFSVLEFDCVCGIMITASHNPKYDNGYKVYWNNGAQLVSPLDKEISTSILSNLEPWDGSWSVEHLRNVPCHSLCRDPFEQVINSYMKAISQHCLHRSINESTSLKFTYTAMHGVGYIYTHRAFESFGFDVKNNFIIVEEQINPDPEFPTVKFPNPEEGKSALDLAMVTADKAGSRIIVASDPDADRLAVAEYSTSPHSQWHVFTGNELGALFGWWAWFNAKDRLSPKNIHMVASTVSSKILQTMAKYEGFHFHETLTGFKWIANKGIELENEDPANEVIFGFEEAIGFMYGMQSPDKDGVSAAVIAAEMSAYLNTKNVTLVQQLQNIYRTYGEHLSINSYFICHDARTIHAIFHRIRNYKDSKPNTYPETVGNLAKVKFVRDLTTGYDNAQPNNKAVLPVSSSSEMITFTLDIGLIMTIRTSGTEPKIKYYTEYIAPVGVARDEGYSRLRQILNVMIEDLLQPDFNKLIPQSA